MGGFLEDGTDLGFRKCGDWKREEVAIVEKEREYNGGLVKLTGFIIVVCFIKLIRIHN